MPLHLPLRSSALFLAFALFATYAAPLLRADTVVLKKWRPPYGKDNHARFRQTHI